MVDDSDKIEQSRQAKQQLKTALTNYVTNLDGDIAATDAAISAVVSARQAVDADNTVNANLKAELRAVETALLAFKTECRNYRTAFVYLRDNFAALG